MTNPQHDTWVGALPFAALILDGQGTILNANQEARQFFAGGEDPVGRPIFGRLAGLETLEEGFAENLAHSTLPPVVLAGRGEDGPTLRVHLRPVHGTDRSVCLALFEPLAGGSQALEQRLADAEARLVAVRRIRHEMNNLLMGVLGHCELLADDATLDANVRGKVEKIMLQSRRLREQVRELSGVVKGS